MRTIFGAAAAAALIWAGPGAAAEYALEANASLAARHESNVDLQPGVDRSERSVSAALTLGLKANTELSSTAVSLAGSVPYYPDRPDLNDPGGSAAFGWDTRLDRGSFGLSASAARDSTRQTEADTGIVIGRRKRTSLAAGGRAAYALDDLTGLSLAAGANSVRFEDGSGLVDYDTRSLSAGASRVLGERLSAGLSATGNHYDTADGATRIRTYGLSANVAYALSERLDLALSAGRQRSRNQRQIPALVCFINNPFPALVFCSSGLSSLVVGTVTLDVDTRNSNTDYGVSLAYRMENAAASGSLSRALNASGIGSVVVTDQAAFGWSAQAGERLAWKVDAAWQRSRAPDDAVADSRLVRATGGLSWRVDEYLTAELSLNRTRSVQEGRSEAAVSTAVFAALRYAWPRLSVSR